MEQLTGPLRIESLAYGGKAVARSEGKVLFVAGAVPGDLVRCRLLREKKRYAEAELIELLEPSDQRRTPPCPVGDICGGCQWQSLPYREQLRWKEQIFHDMLQRQAGAPNEALQPIVAAPQEWNYRSRVQFKCYVHDGRLLTGFYRPGSHFVVDIDNCPVVAESLNRALGCLKPILAASSYAASIPQIDMGLGDDGRVRVVVHALQGADELAQLCAPVAKRQGYSLFSQSGRKSSLRHVSGPQDITLTVDSPPVQLAYGPGGFAQINLEQNRRLVDDVIAAAELKGSERVLDLYCGMGNFSLPLARRAKLVDAVEDFDPSILKGRENAAANGIENITFSCEPAEGYLTQNARRQPYDLVLLDPPRSGAYRIMKELLTRRPPKIIYVSCDPATLTRDLKPLLHGGYRLLQSRPYDLFPQTYHLESISVLELAA